MRSQRNLIRDRAVMLAKSGAPPERAITQAIWEHRRPGRWYDAEDEMRFVLECRAAIERALNPAIVRLDPPRQPGVLPNPPAAGFSIDGLPLKAQPPIATDGLIRGLMDAPRHKIGVQLPRQLPSPQAVLWAMRIAIAKCAPIVRRRHAITVSTQAIAAKGWKLATR